MLRIVIRFLNRILHTPGGESINGKKSYPLGSELGLGGKEHSLGDELLGRTTVCPLPCEESLAAEVMRERRLIENLREGEGE